MKIIISSFLTVIVLFVFMLSHNLYNDFEFWTEVAESQVGGSFLYEFSMKRIYENQEKEKFTEVLIDRVKNNNRSHLYKLYFRIIGVAGEESAVRLLVDKYFEYQNKVNFEYLQFQIIISLGSIGGDEAIEFLEDLLEMKEVKVPKFIIARSLFLIDGEGRGFVNYTGRHQKYKPSRKIKELHDLISNVKGRSRNFEEMIALDSLFEPDNSSETNKGTR